MKDRPKPSLMQAAAAVLVVLTGLYIGAYSMLVTPRTDKFMNMIGASKLVIAPRYGRSEEEGLANRVFAPIHWLDRRIRTRMWGGPVPTKEEWDAFHRQGMPHGIPLWSP